MTSKNKSVGVLTTVLTLTIIFILSVRVNAQNNTWVAPSEADKIENPLKNNADAIKKGKAMYNKLCSICHGAKGKGDGMAGMALKPKPANFTKALFTAQSDGAVFWKLTEGRAPMAGYKETLKDEERWQLVSYLRTLAK